MSQSDHKQDVTCWQFYYHMGGRGVLKECFKDMERKLAPSLPAVAELGIATCWKIKQDPLSWTGSLLWENSFIV